jgi:hypothetical protein
MLTIPFEKKLGNKTKKYQCSSSSAKSSNKSIKNASICSISAKRFNKI